MAKILVVDAGPINRRFVAALLRNHGHQPLEAPDREVALRLMRAERPDLVVVDIQLADVDGVQLALDLRSDPVGAAGRIVLRARSDLEPEARALARALGAGFIAKPANPVALLAAIERSLADPASLARNSGAADALLGPVIGLVRRLAERREPLEAARSALEFEIRKRLLAEEQLAQSIVTLKEEALHDALTGLYNRRYLDASLEREESRARRTEQTMAVLMIDVDHFKRFNDTLGHVAGDAVLREVGRYVASLARREDIAARYGGDEFTLVLAQTSLETGLARARTLSAGARSLKIEGDDGRLGPVSLSVGVAVFPDHGSSLHAVLESADAALRRCKHSGRGGIVLAEKSA